MADARPEEPGTEPRSEPRGTLVLRTRAMPADTNPSGDIFGGWLLAQMDIASGMLAEWRADGRIATVAVQEMVFHRPVRVGDVVCCYAEVLRTGTTSVAVLVEAWVLRRRDQTRRVKVTEGVFTFVAIDDAGRKRPLPPLDSIPHNGGG
ncbi:MAG: acyl-CoA thioesterase [Hyphomicrobiales bacterium]|nr:acyl-CoA thioesterase [Hyphomicrobiales bacterium]